MKTAIISGLRGRASSGGVSSALACGVLALGLLGVAPACSGKSSRHLGETDSTDGGTAGEAPPGESGGAGTGGSGGSSPTPEAGASSGGVAGDTPESTLALDGEPFYTRAQRLTNSQWERAVTDILRLPSAPNLAQDFETPVAGVTDFTNNERVLFVSGRQFAAYELAAETVAALATSSPEALSALYSGDDAPGFVREFGRRAFRRPLTDAEVERYVTVFARGEELYGAGFANGAGFVVRAMLQSPHFLYRTELGEAGAALNGYELASKLSFWLRGTTPSDALLDAAGAGELDSEAGLVATAEQMLEEPSAAEVMRDFNSQWNSLQRFQHITKTGVPEYTESLNAELEQAAHAFFDRAFRQNLGLREILTSRVAFVGPATAALYGVAPPAAGLEERELGPSRPGYFTQVPFLLLYAFNDEPDSIRRGHRLSYDVLCADPGTALPTLPPVPPLEQGQTNRERITALTESCAAVCHGVFINPLGFAFENFDGMGRERELDNGTPVDTAAAYPFASGAREFSGAPELMQLLAAEEQVHLCYAKKIASYGLQRDIVESDRPLLAELAPSAEESTKAVMLSLVRSTSFRQRPAGVP